MKFMNRKILLTSCFTNRTFLTLFKLNFKSWSIVFFGSDNFSVPSLEKLVENMKKKRIKKIEVVTPNEFCPVYKYALLNELKTHFWPPVLEETYDFGVIVSFGKLIPKSIIDKFSLGILNVHASLLPKWRGSMPIFHCLKNGDTVTGITIITIDAKFDTGKILLQKSATIGNNELMPSLYNKLSKLGYECLLEVIERMPKCLEESRCQPDEGISYAPKINKSMCLVKWNEMTAVEVYNLYRALYGVFFLSTTLQGIKIKLLCLSLTDFSVKELTKSLPGKLYYRKEDECMFVQCKDKPLRICTVSVNKKVYLAKWFYQGFLGTLPDFKRQLGS